MCGISRPRPVGRKGYARRWSAGFCAFFCVLAAILPLCGTARAADAEHTAPVRVGFFPFEGYYEVDDSGERSGYGYELLQQMAQHANLSYVYVDNVGTWSEMEQMLLDGRIDMLTSVQKTPENEARFAFSDTPISTSSTMLTVKSGTHRLSAGEYSSYDGVRVGVIRGNAHAQKFKRFAAEHNFRYTEVCFDSLESLENALQAGGEIDACVTSSLRPLHNEWIIEQFDPAPFYMMMRKDDAALIRTVNNALRQMTLYMPNWQTDLFNEYYAPDNGSNLLLSAEERAYIEAQRGHVFRVAVSPDNAPFSTFRDGTACGIIPEIFAEIAKRAGISYEVVQTEDSGAYDALIRAGDVELVMDAGWSYSEAENEGYKLTAPYISLSVAQVSKIGRAPAETAPAAVPDGTLLERLSHASMYGMQRYVVGPSANDAIQAVISGTCDRAILYTAVAQQSIQNNLRDKLQMSLLPNISVNLSVGMIANQDYLLLSVLSKSAQSVQREFAQEVLLKRTTSARTHLSTLDYFYLNPLRAAVFLLGGAMLLAASIFLLLWANRQRRLNQTIQKAKLEADRANEAKSAFLSSMSHDLRTPLNGIVGFTDLAIREPDNEKRQDYLRKIQASGRLLTDLVEDTLELSRIESGKMVLQPEAVDGGQLGRAVVMAVESAAALKNIRLCADPSQYPDETVWVDRVKLQKIMLNLLSNAIKYTPPGGTVSMRVEIIDPPVNGRTRRIVVEDNGIGMSEAFLTQIYEPFAQEHRPEAGDATGTGLGLAIVKRIVDLMGGVIAVESKIGQGTRVTVELPVCRIEEERGGAAAELRDVSRLAGKRILLCEDNPLNAEIATLFLKENGMEAVWARDGQEGLDRFSSSEEGFFDAVLMDLRMPVLDGYAAAQAIRKLRRADAQTVPIFALSADAFVEELPKAADAGMNGYLTKPIDQGKILKAFLDAGL